MQRAFLIACSTLLLSTSAQAARVLDEANIAINGEQRRYYHLHDGNTNAATPILVISGSGCKDFGSRVPSFFESYPAPVNVYFLEKTGIQKGDDGQTCSRAYREADYLERRVEDNLAFITQAPGMKGLGQRSVGVLGFSEGGMVAPIVALRSPQIGWLATAGAGGLPQSQGFLIFADRGVEPYAKPLSRDIFLKTFAAIMGENDDSEAIESGRALRDYFAQHPSKNFTFIEYANASHALRAPDKNHLPEFIASLAKWLKSN